jgi:hypothetical protein
MTGYQPIVIPFNYPGIYGAPSVIRTRGFQDLQSRALGHSAIGAYNWWSLMESNHLPATPLNNGYRVTAGNGEQAPKLSHTL